MRLFPLSARTGGRRSHHAHTRRLRAAIPHTRHRRGRRAADRRPRRGRPRRSGSPGRQRGLQGRHPAPLLTGIGLRLDNEAGTLTLHATDRYRFAVRTLAWKDAVLPDCTAVIPTKAL
ncbi:DNA polymerase III subunit beta family protein, partial [Streptomyces doebereineriae]